MGAVFMTCGYSGSFDREIKDQVLLKASRSRTFTSPSKIRSTNSITGIASRTGAPLLISPSSLSDSNEPLTLLLPSMHGPTPAILPTFIPDPALPPTHVITSGVTAEVAVPLASQWGSLTESEINPVLSNVAEGSEVDDGDAPGTSIPLGAPSTSQSDGILCVRAKQVAVFDKEKEQQKQKQKQKQKQQQQQQQQDHSHHHHHHHRHNHSYHGQQQPQCCARLGGGDSGASGGKHRLHSNSCVLV